MKKVSIFLLFAVLSSFCFSQDDIKTTFIKPLQENGLFREKVFLHLNKTTYFSNENIWFTSYVSDEYNNKPSKTTSNLHVNILDENGAVIDHKIIFIQNGVGTGDFLIDNKYNSSKYFVQAFTNYMKNFGKDNVYIQKINVLDPSQKKKNTIFKNEYDLQAFPESGYFLEGVYNTVGIKALINGKGYPYMGVIKNSHGKEVATFQGNKFGMASSNFFYNENETYTATIKINNTEQKINLPAGNKTGVNFNIDNTNSEQLKVTLFTNQKTISTLKNKSLSFLIYRNNNVSDAVTLTFKSETKTQQELLFDKNKMLYGVNTITLFQNSKPIAERKFFVDKTTELTAVLIEQHSTENDSIKYKIETKGSNFMPVPAQLSISTLPVNSKTFEDKQNIKSAFLLTPYVNGHIENPAYYFKNKNIQEKEFLDLLLLNQGWVAYTLDEKIKNINPKEKYAFETGFTVVGKTKKFPKGYEIGMLSKKNRLSSFSSLNNKNVFTFNNIFAYKGDTAKIAFIKKNNHIVKPSIIEFLKPTSKNSSYKYLTEKFGVRDFIFSEKNKSHNSVENIINSPNQLPGAEQLDVVFLKDVKKKKKETVHDKEANIAVKRNEIAASFYQNKKVTEQIEQTFQTIFEYFTSLGYVKRTTHGRYFISLRNAPKYFMGGEGVNPDNTVAPDIFVEGNNIMPNSNEGIEVLKNLSMKDVDEILINKFGAGTGINGEGGVIKIYLKEGNHKYYEDTPKDLYKSLVLLTGFDKAKEYYTPLYNIYNKDTYNWTEIDWKNSINTDNNGEAIFKIPTNKFSNEFQFIINGISENGLLFHNIYKTESDDF